MAKNSKFRTIFENSEFFNFVPNFELEFLLLVIMNVILKFRTGQDCKWKKSDTPASLSSATVYGKGKGSVKKRSLQRIHHEHALGTYCRSLRLRSRVHKIFDLISGGKSRKLAMFEFWSNLEKSYLKILSVSNMTIFGQT